METTRFSFPVGNEGSTVTVDSWEELQAWLQKERAQWAWLVRGDGLTDANNWAGNVQSQWDQIINGVANQQASGIPLQNALPTLQPLTHPLAVSTERDGALILDIRGAAGDVAAAYAYAFLKRSLSLGDVRTTDQLVGLLLTAIPDVRDPVALSERLQRERQNYRSSIRTAVEKTDQGTKENSAAFDALMKRVRQDSASMLKLRRNRWRGVQQAFVSQGQDAIASIKGVENAYMEAMRLQAPVKYWTDKAADHAKEGFQAASRLGFFFLVAALLLGFAFYAAADFVLQHAPAPGQPTPVALYVVISGGLAILSTLAFWIGRLLTRLYLSEHHLKTDADERAVMTKTYLALTKEGQATDAERQIVLTQLFRGSADGIVKDDGPPEIAFQSLLSKLIARP